MAEPHLDVFEYGDTPATLDVSFVCPAHESTYLTCRHEFPDVAARSAAYTDTIDDACRKIRRYLDGDHPLCTTKETTNNG